MADEFLDQAPVEQTEQVATPDASQAPEAAATPDAPVERVDTIRQAFQDIKDGKPTNRGQHAKFQPRDTGKFAPGQPQFPNPARPAFPASLKKELQRHWESAPPELLSAFTEREAAQDRGVQELRSRMGQAQEVLDHFKPYEWMLKNENATPASAIGSLLQTAAILRTGTPAQKASSVAQVMQQFGIHPNDVMQFLGGRQMPQPDPQYTALQQQVQELNQQFTQRQQAEQQQQEAKVISVIQQFAADPANVHFDKLQDKILMILQSPQILGDISAMSEAQKLKAAYDTAVRLDPVLSSQPTSEQQTRRLVNTAKAAAVQVNGAPGSSAGMAVDLNDRRAVIANAMSRYRQ